MIASKYDVLSELLGNDYTVNRNVADCGWIECKYMGFVKKMKKMPTQFQLRISFQQFMVVRPCSIAMKDNDMHESGHDLPSKNILGRAGKSKNG